MRKLLIIPTLLLGATLYAKQYSYEGSLMAGYNFAQSSLHFKDNSYSAIAAEIQYNHKNLFLSPELSLIYTNPDNGLYDSKLNCKTDILRVALNGVYSYETLESFTPFAKVGLGYEEMTTQKYQNKNGLFFDIGVGAKVPLKALSEHLALKFEAIYMAKNGDGKIDNNLLALLGLNFAFGSMDEKRVEKSEEIVVAPEPEEIEEAEEIVVAPEPEEIEEAEEIVVAPEPEEIEEPEEPIVVVPIDGDDDNDGIKNSQDRCTQSALGTIVDESGCEKELRLRISFGLSSGVLNEEQRLEIATVAEALKSYPSYKAKLVGYSDSSGDKNKNLTLSKQRAQSVYDALLKSGVDATRVSYDGAGIAEPIATNETKEGRALNRRVEVTLFR